MIITCYERKKLWVPSKEWMKSAKITRFIDFVNKKYKPNITNGKELYKWSVMKVKEF
ncbi:MAG: hypothetical protein ACFFD2_08940 [Promethearchaeota archaeon]